MMYRGETKARRRSGGCCSSSVSTLLIPEIHKCCQSTSKVLLYFLPSISQHQQLPLLLEKFICIGYHHCCFPLLVHCGLASAPYTTLKLLSWVQLYISRADPVSDFQVFSYLTSFDHWLWHFSPWNCFFTWLPKPQVPIALTSASS